MNSTYSPRSPKRRPRIVRGRGRGQGAAARSGGGVHDVRLLGCELIVGERPVGSQCCQPLERFDALACSGGCRVTRGGSDARRIGDRWWVGHGLAGVGAGSMVSEVAQGLPVGDSSELDSSLAAKHTRSRVTRAERVMGRSEVAANRVFDQHGAGRASGSFGGSGSRLLL